MESQGVEIQIYAHFIPLFEQEGNSVNLLGYNSPLSLVRVCVTFAQLATHE